MLRNIIIKAQKIHKNRCPRYLHEEFGHCRRHTERTMTLHRDAQCFGSGSPKEVNADEELAFVENNNTPFRVPNEELPQ